VIVVLDTNVLASGVLGFHRSKSVPGMLLRRWRAGTFTLTVSEHILAELVRTFSNPFFTSQLDRQQIEAALATLRTGAVIQPITVRVARVATHPEDDLVLATALSAGAGYVVTGDKRLQDLDRHRNVAILSPRQFPDLLEAEAH
jgi:putative PIN family toxin of toxin-antitoxin system